MKRRLAVTVVAAALAAVSLPAAPARASHLCQIWAPPFDRVACTVVAIVCEGPWPPLSICN